jgi:general secretion pathway protein G
MGIKGFCRALVSAAKRQRRPRAQRGMTLIEIMVVLVILGMIAGAIGWNVMGQLKDANIKTAGLDVKAIAGAVDMYQVKNSKLPDSLEVLVPSELRELRKDPWGNAYTYIKSGAEGYDVCSYGPDKNQGGGDDICANTAQAQNH